MIRMNPQAFSCLYSKDVIAFGTGTIGKRMIPYLAQDPSIKLHGVTNSRITAEDEGAFLETGLPLRSVQAWAKSLPNATIFVTAFNEIDVITAFCREAGFQNFAFITGEMMNAFLKIEAHIAESQLARMMEPLCLANEIRDVHKAAFSEFRGCNKGKVVAVVGTGPTLQYYTQIPGAVHIGVNASFLKEDLTLDYYFVVNYEPDWCKYLKNYDFVKFFGISTNADSKDHFPEYVIEENGGRRFFSMIDVPGIRPQTNIEYYPLMAYNSIIFRAIHFALYTRPKRLLLIGCDCSACGHFDEDESKMIDKQYIKESLSAQWIDGYQNVKKFASIHYPDTEIISVNPVGLKGLFHDMYTKNYLDKHPELDCTACEII